MSPARLLWLYARGPFLWIGLGIALIGLVMMPIAVLMWQAEQTFREHAVQAVATVTGKESRLEKKPGPQGRQPSEVVHLLSYIFKDPHGQLFQGKARVTGQEYQGAKKGDLLKIEYRRDRPEESRPIEAAAPARWGLLFLTGMGILFSSAGLGLTAIALLSAAGRARLVRTGTPVLGVAGETVENSSALKVEGTYRLTYNFTDESGSNWEGCGPPQPWSLAARWDSGEPILVLYDPRNPGRNEADVFEARNDDLARLTDEPAE